MTEKCQTHIDLKPKQLYGIFIVLLKIASGMFIWISKHTESFYPCNQINKKSR